MVREMARDSCPLACRKAGPNENERKNGPVCSREIRPETLSSCHPKTTPLLSQIYSLDPSHLDILVRPNPDINCQRSLQQERKVGLFFVRSVPEFDVDLFEPNSALPEQAVPSSVHAHQGLLAFLLASSFYVLRARRSRKGYRPRVKVARTEKPYLCRSGRAHPRNGSPELTKLCCCSFQKPLPPLQRTLPQYPPY